MNLSSYELDLFQWSRRWEFEFIFRDQGKKAAKFCIPKVDENCESLFIIR